VVSVDPTVSLNPYAPIYFSPEKHLTKYPGELGLLFFLFHRDRKLRTFELYPLKGTKNCFVTSLIPVMEHAISDAT
jgi:hypothetical protein